MIESMKPKEVKENSNESDEAVVSEVKLDNLAENTDNEEVLKNVQSEFIEPSKDLNVKEELAGNTEVLETEKPEKMNDIESYTYAP